jgi:hypothetical protein
MASKTDVCNRALAALEAPSVVDIDSAPGKAPQNLVAQWDLSLEEALEAHPWHHARWSWPNPATLSENPDPTMARAYALPSDCVRVYQLWPEAGFNEFQGCITTDLMEAPTLIGSRRVLEPGRFSAHFCSYLASHLAWVVSKQISASEAIRARCEKDWEKAFQRAASFNGRSGNLRRVGADSFMLSRLRSQTAFR